jgi:hypothetical protein
MSDNVREMTLQEEIEALPIDENIKDRLLCKLKRYNNYLAEENRALIAKQCEEMYSRIVPLEEANAALLTACEGMSRAMVAQQKVK